MAVDLSIPAIAELAELPQWTNWKFVTRKGKTTKPPVQPSGRMAKSNDPTTWHSFEECAAASGKVGFVLKPPHIGIDLDGCRDPENGDIDDWALEIIRDISSYTEVSPSGTGVKIIATADPMPELRSNKLVIEKRDDGKNRQIEVFNRDRYFCITGQHLDDTPDTIEDSTEAAERLAARLGRPQEDEKPSEAPETTLDLDRLPVALQALLKGDRKLRACWTQGKKLGRGRDTSASGLDFSLALYLSRHLDDHDLEEALRAFPFGQIGGGKLTGKAKHRRLEKLLEEAQKVRETTQYDNTQDGIAQCFRDRFKDKLRYCHTAGAWFIYTGTHWTKDERKLAFTWARHTGRELGFDGKASTCAGVEKFAAADEAFAVTHEIWDANPYLLGTPSGTVDLREGRLRKARQDDYITKLAGVAPSSAPHPSWSKFLDEATQGDRELQTFLQRMAGYCLTGDTREHALFFVYGPGGNGKSVFLNVLSGILGDYAKTSAMETFQAANSDRHPTDLAMLAGARLVTASETEEGRLWAESRIKQLTGGDTIAARFMRQDFFEYRPSFKLVIVGNHKPALRNVDDAARRRFNIVPFVHKPAEPDPYLEEKLKDEWPQILGWMIEGCVDWQAEGLARPAVVVEATNEYFSEQDLFGQWLEERCIINSIVKDTSAKLFADWRVFCEHAGVPAGNAKTLGDRLRKAGFERSKVGGQKGWKGVTCRHANPNEGWEDCQEGPIGTDENVDRHTRAHAHMRGSDSTGPYRSHSPGNGSDQVRNW